MHSSPASATISVQGLSDSALSMWVCPPVLETLIGLQTTEAWAAGAERSPTAPTTATRFMASLVPK
jgi:hypothetical protein